MIHKSRQTTGVSPVVAVILLVAVTVALSAVIGAFAMNLGQQTTSGEGSTASSAVDVSKGSTASGNDTITLTVTVADEPVAYTIDGGNETTIGTVGSSVTLVEGEDYQEGDTIAIVSSTGDQLHQTVSTDDTTSSGGTTVSYTQIDPFEDKDISEYSGDTGVFTVRDTVAAEGSYSLRMNSTTYYNGIVSMPGDGLNAYPDAGDTFRYKIRFNGTGDQWSGVGFGWNSAGNPNGDGYYASIVAGENSMNIGELNSGTWQSTIASDNVTIPRDEWLTVEVDWQTDGTMTMTIWAANGTKLNSITGSDTTFSDGGIAFRTDTAPDSGSGKVYVDDVKETG